MMCAAALGLKDVLIEQGARIIMNQTIVAILPFLAFVYKCAGFSDNQTDKSFTGIYGRAIY